MKVVDGKVHVTRPCPDGREGCLVAHYMWIDEDAYNVIHDCYYDKFNKAPNKYGLIGGIYLSLPDEIKLLAENWGWNDTEIRENINSLLIKNDF
jgi:hypothetical protein